MAEQPDPSGEFFLLGTVIGAWGLKGALKIRPETDFPDRVAEKRAVWLRHPGLGTRRYEVTGGRWTGKTVILSLAGLDTPEAVMALRGAEVLVDEDAVEKLPAGSFYHHQIVGLRVVRPDGRVLGRVRDIMSAGGTDLYVVGEGDREFMLPAVKAFIRRIDVEAGEIVADPPAGLEETG